MGEKYYRIGHNLLSDLAAKVFGSCGMPENDARILADSLIRSDMRGVKSHGLLRVPSYVKWLEDGTWSLKSELKVIKETPCTTAAEGHNGIGLVLSRKACQLTKEKALKTGMAYTTVGSSNHFGEAGLWSTELCDEKEGLIGFCATSAVAICAAPGGIGAGIGSNPFSFAVPAGKYAPVCLDVAVGTMAQGKIWEYKRLDKTLPEKAWIGPDGNYVTDPNRYDISQYIMAPFGGHKGYGLGVIMETLTSFLAGGTFQRVDKKQADSKALTSHAFMAVKIDHFTDYDAFKAHMEEYIEYLHGLPVHTDAPPVMYPGEIEAAKEASSLKNGVAIPQKVFEDMAEIAVSKGIQIDNYRVYEKFEQ